MSKRLLILMIMGFGLILIQANSSEKNVFQKKISALTKVIHTKVMASLKSLGDTEEYPKSVSGKDAWVTGPIKGWTSGFFPGVLWYTYKITEDNNLIESAKKWTEGLSSLQSYSGSHDIGFMVFCSFGNGYLITKNEEYRKVILQTSKTLLTRFDHKIGCIRSWDHSKDKWEYPVIIDNMMNLEMLFWASQNGGTKEMYDVAVKHAETTMKNHFRPDGSSYHVVGYNPVDGSVKSKNTHQGYSDESCWARGQAWAIYGFTMAYRFTKDERFLNTAKKAADYFLKNLPKDMVPYWDFNAPDIPNEPRDASAAAIASSALFELSGYVKDKELQKKYSNNGTAILESLSSSSYFLHEAGTLGIIGHAVGNKPKNDQVDVTLIYGDYYFLEALIRYKQLIQKVAKN